jgi:hypothetical protein
VPDPDGEAYDNMLRAQRTLRARQEAKARQIDDANRRARLLGDRRFGEAAEGARMPHPNAISSMIPVLGAAQEAIADGEDGNYIGAAGNMILAGMDAMGGGLLRGGLKTTGSVAWKSKPWEAAGMRKWLGSQGILEKGQHGHHWLIPQGGWGKAIPDFIKNQPWNIKGLDAVTHGRVHGPYTVDGAKLPRFNDVQRIWYGTPDSAKALAAGAVARTKGLLPRDQRGAVPPPLMQ